MNKVTYLFLRLAIGLSAFGHGLVRLPKLNKFSSWMVTGFEKTMLPRAVVIPFSYILPFVEFMIGILLILGLFTKQAIYMGVTVMCILILGTTLQENWDAIPTQLIHVAFFAVLFQFLSSNEKSLDRLLKNNLS
ncbi:MAG TPA: DoxX family membrane protein [Puia sp.]|jgi:thiosulfate dehydrogenase [quinone] large subunit